MIVHHRAIQASLALYQERVGHCEIEEVNTTTRIAADSEEASSETVEGPVEQLTLALRLSKQQQLEEEQRRLLEEETFRQVLELSLTDK